MIEIKKGSMIDIDELEVLYNDLNDYLESGINYPGWIKGIYPTRETAENGIRQGNLFTAKINNAVVGSVILNHEPEDAYNHIVWGVDTGYEDILVIHTLTIHPLYMKKGIALKLMNFAREYGLKQKMKAIRLDVSVNNTPAITLYEKLGYKYMGTVDLGLNYPHLIWFRLYEMLL